jgi:hypothetical protein
VITRRPGVRWSQIEETGYHYFIDYSVYGWDFDFTVMVLRNKKMKNLIEALTIFLKYQDLTYPTGCEHDVLYIFMELLGMRFRLKTISD